MFDGHAEEVVPVDDPGLPAGWTEDWARAELEQYVYVRSSSPRRTGDEDDFG